MQVGNFNSYASHSSKETKSLANKASTAQEDVQLHNDTLQNDVVGDKSSDVLATHGSKQIAKLSESQKSGDKFVDQDKSQCKAPDYKDAAIATSQQEHPDSDDKALKATNLEESERIQFGNTPEVFFWTWLDVDKEEILKSQYRFYYRYFSSYSS